MPSVALRDRGIYALPDGTQVVVCTDSASGATILYYLTDWRLFGGEEIRAERNASTFRILHTSPADLIYRLGQPTRWNLQDLLDTGRTAH